MPPDGDGTRFRAVIFDVGGVLTTSPAAIMATRAHEAGIDLMTFAGLALGPLDIDTDHPWHRAERGEAPLYEVVAEIRQMAADAGITSPFPEHPTADEVLAAIRPIDEMVEFCCELRAAGLRVGVLTNNIVEWGAWREIVPVREIADVIVDSCEVGMRKPDPRIFTLTLERLGVTDPSAAIFLDDFRWNVDGAKAMGMTGVLVGDPAAAIADTRTLLGLY